MYDGKMIFLIVENLIAMDDTGIRAFVCSN